MSALSILAALAKLAKVLKFDDSKLKATIDGRPLTRCNTGVHPFRFDLEAWGPSPLDSAKEDHYRAEVSYFHAEHPDLTVNGEPKYREAIHVSVDGKNVRLQLTFDDFVSVEAAPRVLDFEYPLL